MLLLLITTEDSIHNLRIQNLHALWAGYTTTITEINIRWRKVVKILFITLRDH